MWEVWYYQSGPKSVSTNPYGTPEPPIPLRNCQSLDWAQKTKKFECLKKCEFLKYRHGWCLKQNASFLRFRPKVEFENGLVDLFWCFFVICRKPIIQWHYLFKADLMRMVTKFIVYEKCGDHWLFLDPPPNIEKITRKLMFSGFVRPDGAKNRRESIP